jgi:hypothetical protein
MSDARFKNGSAVFYRRPNHSVVQANITSFNPHTRTYNVGFLDSGNIIQQQNVSESNIMNRGDHIPLAIGTTVNILTNARAKVIKLDSKTNGYTLQIIPDTISDVKISEITLNKLAKGRRVALSQKKPNIRRKRTRRQ